MVLVLVDDSVEVPSVLRAAANGMKGTMLALSCTQAEGVSNFSGCQQLVVIAGCFQGLFCICGNLASKDDPSGGCL